MAPPPHDGSTYRFLSDVIIARGLVDPAAMKGALQASLAGRSLADILVERGDINDEDLARAVAEHHRLDHVDLAVFGVDRQATTLIEAATAARLGAVPIAFLPSGAVAVALHDPTASAATRELAGLFDRRIQPIVVSRTQLEALTASLLAGGHDPIAGPATAASAELSAPEMQPYASAEVVSSSTHPADILRPSAPPPAPPPAPMQIRHENEQRAAQEHARVADERARAAEEHARSADERARAAEEHARAADERARLAGDHACTADEHIRAADARAAAAEEHAAATEGRARRAESEVSGANARAEGLMAAATAANEALARLVGNCERLEREAGARESEMQALRSEVEAGSAERVRLETEVRRQVPGEHLLALKVRIAELERELSDAHELAARAPAVEVEPAASAVVAPPAPEVQVAPPAPVAAVAPPAPEARVAQPAPEPEARAAPLAPEAVAEESPAEEELVVERYEQEPVQPTIDIVADPSTYVSALAPMPPVNRPAAVVKNAKSEAKARGLRRLTGALKRG